MGSGEAGANVGTGVGSVVVGSYVVGSGVVGSAVVGSDVVGANVGGNVGSDEAGATVWHAFWSRGKDMGMRDMVSSGAACSIAIMAGEGPEGRAR